MAVPVDKARKAFGGGCATSTAVSLLRLGAELSKTGPFQTMPQAPGLPSQWLLIDPKMFRAAATAVLTSRVGSKLAGRARIVAMLLRMMACRHHDHRR